MAPRRRRGAADAAQDETNSEQDAPKNRPPNTAFRQQRMKAWQCVLTPKLIVTIFSILAAIYLGFGAYLLYLAHTVRDLRIDYTDCRANAPRDGKPTLIPENLITSHFSASDSDPNLDPRNAYWQVFERKHTFQDKEIDLNICQINFTIPENLKPTVSFYYYLENFYQNHRRYVASFNAKQLLGDPVDGATINSSTCDQISHDPKGSGKIVYPCGLVANSLFNDTFSNPVSASNNMTPYVMEQQGIAWSGLRDLYGQTRYNVSQIVPPPNWAKRYPNGYTEEFKPPNLQADEHFQNWMMLAASPNFYKLYQRNTKDVMQKGVYQVEIRDDFDATKYNGRKSFVITTISTMGSRNIWPGIIFLVVGGVCLLLDVYFILSFFVWKPRKLGDASYLSWNQPQMAPQGGSAGPGS